MLNLKTVLEDGTIVSTIQPRFMAWYGKYETAFFSKYSRWNIIEGYSTLELALQGHEKYSKMSIEELEKLKRIG